MSKYLRNTREKKFSLTLHYVTEDEISAYQQGPRAVAALADIAKLLRDDAKYVDEEQQMRSFEIKEKFWEILEEYEVKLL